MASSRGIYYRPSRAASRVILFPIGFFIGLLVMGAILALVGVH